MFTFVISNCRMQQTFIRRRKCSCKIIRDKVNLKIIKAKQNYKYPTLLLGIQIFCFLQQRAPPSVIHITRRSTANCSISRGDVTMYWPLTNVPDRTSRPSPSGLTPRTFPAVVPASRVQNLWQWRCMTLLFTWFVARKRPPYSTWQSCRQSGQYSPSSTLGCTLSSRLRLDWTWCGIVVQMFTSSSARTVITGVRCADCVGTLTGIWRTTSPLNKVWLVFSVKKGHYS